MQSFSLGHPPPDLLQAGPYAGPVAMTHNKENYIQCQPTGDRRQDRCVMTNPQEPCVEDGAKARVDRL